ncbi:MAG: HEPN domain-containing protein [Chloroflexota bacterium]
MPPEDPRVQLTREWLDRAARDLRLARLAVDDSSLVGLAAFHCQQATEKALKAYLAWRNQPPRRTHDLPTLLAQCQTLDPAFAALQLAATTLDDCLTAGRYPDKWTGPLVCRGNRGTRANRAGDGIGAGSPPTTGAPGQRALTFIRRG